jgi:hypothetical protein
MAEHPREYLEHLLRTLRESEMGWIAEEIEAEIATGRLVERDVEGGRSRKGLAVEELDSGERLAIALRILLELAQVGHAVWLEQTELLHRRLGAQAVEYVDIRGEESERFEPFTGGFDRAADELATVLRKVSTETALWGPDVQRLSLRPARIPWGNG